ncbi:hypothetical protein L9F63_006967, partial [Diploptera punctata]
SVEMIGEVTTITIIMLAQMIVLIKNWDKKLHVRRFIHLIRNGYKPTCKLLQFVKNTINVNKNGK